MKSFEQRLDPELLASMQLAQDAPLVEPSPYTPNPVVNVEDISIPGPQGAPNVMVRVYQPAKRSDAPAAAFLWIHGGGFTGGTYQELPELVEHLVIETGAVIVSTEYRLAPEHPFPAATSDCFAALKWLAASADELNIDTNRIAIGGGSAGGCLAAAVALMARDRGEPQLCYQFLLIPMTDDRMETQSFEEITDMRVFNRDGVIAAWKAYLGNGDRSNVSPYAAPARATDLSGLPPAYIIVEELDPLRDEGIAYANRLMQAGVNTELHVYPGTYHGSFVAFPDTTIAKRMISEYITKLKEVLST